MLRGIIQSTAKSMYSHPHCLTSGYIVTYPQIARFAVKSIKLGDLGEGTKEATIKQWFVKCGDKVAEY